MMIAMIGAALLTVGASPDAGRQAFFDPGISDRGVACATCHEASPEEDTDGLIRAGHSLFDVARRPHWRGDVRRSSLPTVRAAMEPCIEIYMGGLRTKDDGALIARFLEQNVGTGKAPPALVIKPSLEADRDYARPKYLSGDPDRGRKLYYRACHSCHPHGDKEGIAGRVAGLDRARVAANVREGTGLLRGRRDPAAWMAFFGADRLSDDEVADIAAFVEGLGAKAR
ncbi:MAG: hypothetical protein HC923_02375 [Myxococcales bacterium]|nr:hypothetical protein [Myxococcales bacterium]